MPAIGRPSGVSPHAWWAKRLCTTSSGSSSCMAISSRMTSRSASTSAAVMVEAVTMSPSTSTAVPRSSSRTRAWKTVYSLVGEGVELAADRVERDGDVHRGALGGALEEQVLEEVRAAVQGGRLVARADADPHADARRAGAGHLLGDDAQAAGQDRTSYARGDRAVGVLDGVEGAGGAVLLHRGPSGAEHRQAAGEAPRPAGQTADRSWVEQERQVTRRRRPRRRRPTPRSRPRPRRRRGPARACRGRRSRRSRPGPSGPPTARPRRPPRACHRPGRGAC